MKKIIFLLYFLIFSYTTIFGQVSTRRYSMDNARVDTIRAFKDTVGVGAGGKGRITVPDTMNINTLLIDGTILSSVTAAQVSDTADVVRSEIIDTVQAALTDSDFTKNSALGDTIAAHGNDSMSVIEGKMTDSIAAFLGMDTTITGAWTFNGDSIIITADSTKITNLRADTISIADIFRLNEQVFIDMDSLIITVDSTKITNVRIDTLNIGTQLTIAGTDIHSIISDTGALYVDLDALGDTIAAHGNDSMSVIEGKMTDSIAAFLGMDTTISGDWIFDNDSTIIKSDSTKITNLRADTLNVGTQLTIAGTDIHSIISDTGALYVDLDALGDSIRDIVDDSIVTATTSTKGIAYFDDTDFVVATDGKVTTIGTSAGNADSLGDLPASDYVLADSIHRLTLTAGDSISPFAIVYIPADSTTIYEADADDTSKVRIIGIAKDSIVAGASGYVYTTGIIYNPAWSWQEGMDIFLSVTAGGMAQTTPQASPAAIVRVARAITDKKIYFLVSLDYTIK